MLALTSKTHCAFPVPIFEIGIFERFPALARNFRFADSTPFLLIGTLEFLNPVLSNPVVQLHPYKFQLWVGEDVIKSSG